MVMMSFFETVRLLGGGKKCVRLCGALAGMVLCLGSVAAWASSPISHVGGATVTKGASSVEFRIGYSEDEPGFSANKRLRIRQHYDYGFTDRYAFRLITAQDKRKGDNLEHQAITMEHRFHLIAREQHGFDGGIRLVYTHSDGDKTPHELEVRFLAQGTIGEKWKWRHNTMMEHDVGPNADDGILLEFRNQVMYRLTPPAALKSFEIGVDMFNDFGRLNDLSGYSNQDHQIGPGIKGSFHNGVFFAAGYRTGISSSGADHLVKFALGRKF